LEKLNEKAVGVFLEIENIEAVIFTNEHEVDYQVKSVARTFNWGIVE